MYTKALLFILGLSCGLSVFCQSPDEMYLAGSANLIKGEYGKAVENLSMAISRDNADEQLFIRRGNALLKMNEMDRAVADFNEANQIKPDVADLWLARAFANEGDAGRAVSYLQNHLQSVFRINEDSIKKDPSFNKIQESAEWEALWQKDWYTGTDKAIADAQFYSRKKQYDEAVSALDKAVLLEPDNTRVLLERGKVFMRQGNFAAAAGDFSSAISKDKTLTPAFKARGVAYLNLEKYKDAAADFTRALRDDVSDFDIYLKRAASFAGLENWTAAIKDMQVYMKYFENDPGAVFTCGEYYYDSQDYINALKCFNRNLKEDPNNPAYFKARGMTYLQTNTYRFAVNDLSMSLDLNPYDSETWMYHGLAAIKTGDTADGCSSLRHAQSMGNAEAVRYVLENCGN
jgi:tetratricopeptide (TPR) repeat protein